MSSALDGRALILRSADKVEAWLRSGCSAVDIPRVQIALLTTLARELEADRFGSGSLTVEQLRAWRRCNGLNEATGEPI
jgi:hypothetical protein